MDVIHSQDRVLWSRDMFPWLWEHISLHQAFLKNRYGAAFTAYFGPEVARSVTVQLSHEQNLIVIHTPNPAAADRLLREFSINTERSRTPPPTRGNGCHGIIVVSNSDTTEPLCQQMQRNGEQVPSLRKEKLRFVHYENTLIPMQKYYWTMPACGPCGAVSHQVDACPNMQTNMCRLQSRSLIVKGGAGP
ncbi:hypothetical protein HPB50_008224 [Hyalomma asiaticum]|uniref:Uncharacterized protein n=1 Tax=Hyalomma asiaticum TaxID=266040 RepID=A0ACB7SDF2_HYAAI|nr:hypothetical protein HPB50_008224 [Hyalomma asiaticum]